MAGPLLEDHVLGHGLAVAPVQPRDVVTVWEEPDVVGCTTLNSNMPRPLSDTVNEMGELAVPFTQLGVAPMEPNPGESLSVSSNVASPT